MKIRNWHLYLILALCVIALNKLDQYDDLKPINQTAEGCAEPGARCYGG